MRELYQELIVDHGKNPRNHHVMDDADFVKQGFNPLCGDDICLYLKVKDNNITAASFTGKGCAISMASCSLLCEIVIGKTIDEVDDIFKCFHDLVTGKSENIDEDKLGKLIALGGVSEYPSRVKCASLAWHTLQAAVHGDKADVSTE